MKKFSTTTISLLVLLSAVCMISWNIGSADLPFGDEAGYIHNALLLLKENKMCGNLYLINYMILLKYITPDPITVHILCRFYTSVLSVFCMFFFLTSFKCLKNRFAIVLICAFWACCRLNIPYSQFGNINLFCLNLVFPSLILLMRKITVNRAIFYFTSLLWAAQIRPEYYAPLLLSTIFFAGMVIYKVCYKKSEWEMILQKKQIISCVLILFVPISLLFFHFAQSQQKINLNKYLLLGLEQCYTSLYSKLHPDEKISAMVEYKNITDKVFNKPESFTDACKKNPKEVVKYLALNGTLNSVMLVPVLLRHRNLFMPESLGKKGEVVELSLILICVLCGTGIGIYGLKQEGCITRNKILQFLYNPKLIILLLFVSASSVAILLLIPDARYWISWIPLIFLWLTWSMSQIYQKIHSKPVSITISCVLILWFCHPLFGKHQSNQHLIREMRKHRNEDILKLKVAGLAPSGVSTFAFGIDVDILSVYTFNALKIKNKEFDFIVINKYFRNSSFWAKNEQFMIEFEDSPEKYGYEFLGKSQNKHQTSVYSKK